VYFGVDQSAALGFMFVYHFSQLLPGIALGAAILVAEGEKLFGKESAFQSFEEAPVGVTTGALTAPPRRP
jgi:hypothetical protein